MKRKILSMLLVLVLLICTVPVYGENVGSEITVFLSVSRYGELVENKSGEPMAYVPVTLSGQRSYNLDDCFRAAHKDYYPDGEAGYASSTGDWGLGVDMLWGDTSYNFGYQVNAGKEAVMGLEHPVEAGDYIDACIYQNSYPNTEAYSYFDSQRTETVVGQEIALSLTHASGYDEHWNTIYSPCDGAHILIDGLATDYVTDENGQVTLCFNEAGTYIISAQKTKVLNEATVPAITAPVCLIMVDTQESQLIHGIAEMYAESDLSAAGGNLPWIVADMAIYEELFPESNGCMSESAKETALRLLAEMAQGAERPGDLAKIILGLRALGYDAERIYTESFEHINLVEKLITLVEDNDESVTNIYTLPYVIMALRQTEPAVAESLIPAALSSQAEWQDVSYGTDAVTPMISALAPYAEHDMEVETAIEESVNIVKGQQRADGLIDGFEGYEAASTGLAVWALSEAGEDASFVMSGEKSLIDGLLSVANEDRNGFPNAFATEQGFRGLLSWCLLTQGSNRSMYDFSNKPSEEWNDTGMQFCPVQFDLYPSRAEVSIDGEEMARNHLFDLPAGEYTYEVSAGGYLEETGTLTVSEEEAYHHTLKSMHVSMRKESGGGGISSLPSVSKPMTKEETDNNEWKGFEDVKQGAWYYPAVQFVYEKGLFGGTDRGFEPESPMTRAMLVTVLLRLDQGTAEPRKTSFTDVDENAWYANSVAWATEKGIVYGVTADAFAPNENITREQLAVILYRYTLYRGIETGEKNSLNFDDVDKISPYAEEAISYAVSNGIIGGKGDNRLCPADKASRAEVATMLMRFMEVIQP